MRESVMPLYHDKKSLLNDVQGLTDKALADGVLIDIPKRRRREQAMGSGQVRINWPKEQKKRFATQYNRYTEIFTKDIGIEALLRKLEAPSDEELRKEAEGD